MAEPARETDTREHANDCQCAACRHEDQWQALSDVARRVVAPLMDAEHRDDG